LATNDARFATSWSLASEIVLPLAAAARHEDTPK
jgi:hypothetical protein